MNLYWYNAHEIGETVIHDTWLSISLGGDDGADSLPDCVEVIGKLKFRLKLGFGAFLQGSSEIFTKDGI